MWDLFIKYSLPILIFFVIFFSILRDIGQYKKGNYKGISKIKLLIYIIISFFIIVFVSLILIRG